MRGRMKWREQGSMPSFKSITFQDAKKRLHRWSSKEIHLHSQPSHGSRKEFDKEELNIRVLKCLDRNWKPKVTAISESKDLSIITTTALFGKLTEHEIEMQRLSELESREKKVKTIALKASSKKSDETEEEVVESSDNAKLNLLVKMFGKYLKRKV